MSERLNFDPHELHSHAGEIEASAAELRQQHAAAHLLLGQSARSLGSGAAAAALSGRLADWEAETSSMYTRQMVHAQNHRDALAKLLEQDQSNAAKLNSERG
ncbi:hypothetical protein MSTE_00749 [Mycobacteroides stephanolepidis]|uniref:WXG100 family type VII secretion target n=1 Tax=[Mycobacterium] stephanolepidis TaxID=1520670 RepID=A0A1Z4ET22_9MYCO|nr:hypothetical protein [[Mycobacterium] stephanolepidis]BAX96084.1 hypothetical protein MSTE_00749 [[Mycobacterium] stephanolepidis]